SETRPRSAPSAGSPGARRFVRATGPANRRRPNPSGSRPGRAGVRRSRRAWPQNHRASAANFTPRRVPGQRRRTLLKSGRSIMASVQSRAMPEVPARKRGAMARLVRSLLGFVWSILHPSVLIAIYILVFSNVLGARMPQGGGAHGYGVYLCAGLIPWLALQEVVLRSTTIFLDQ